MVPKVRIERYRKMRATSACPVEAMTTETMPEITPTAEAARKTGKYTAFSNSTVFSDFASAVSPHRNPAPLDAINADVEAKNMVRMYQETASAVIPVVKSPMVFIVITSREMMIATYPTYLNPQPLPAIDMLPRARATQAHIKPAVGMTDWRGF